MPVIKYTGTQQRWPELAVTGRQSVWSPGQIEDRTSAEATSLIAAGNFELVGGDLKMLPISAAELASPGADTLRQVNTVWRTSSGGLYQSNGTSLQPFSGASLSGAAEDLTISTGSFTFTGPAGRFVLNHQGVYFPLLANMPGFYGARPVVNFFLNSSTPGSPTAWDTLADGLATFAATTDTLNGATIGALTVTNAATAGGPYERGYFGNWYGAGNGSAPYNPGQWYAGNAWPPGQIMVMRAQARTITAPTGWSIYQRHRDDAVAPTESLGGSITLSTGFQAITAAMESNAAYGALGTRITLAANGTGDGRVAQIQLEDLTGDKGPYVSGEYVPAGAAPTWRWFNTAKANTRTNSGYNANYAALVPLKNPSISAANAAGILTDGIGAALSGLAGLLMEPAGSNLVGGWNTLANIGHAKASGSITGTSGRVPFLSGNTTAYIEAASGQMVGNFNGTSPTDITLTLNGVSAGNDSIDSTTTNFLTAGFFVGMNIWVWRADTLRFGPMPVASVTANKIGLTGTFFGSTRASGTGTRILRCPGNGDNIMLLLNDGSAHYTTINGAPTLPAAGAWDTKAGITLTLADAPPSDGGWASTDNGTKCYYWKDHTDFGISTSGGTGVTIKPVYDRSALITAGLGYLCPMGLALEIYGGTSGSATITLGATGSLGTASRDTQISAWAYRASGSGSMALKLESHANQVTMTDAAWARKSVQQTSAGTQNRPAVITATNTTIRIIGWSVEQAGAAAAVATISSPIVTFGDTAAKTRTATRCTRPWNGTAKNNIARSLTWTPTQGSLTDATQKQTLWSLYADASNYLELSITGTTVTWRKRRGGTNFDVTASLTPVAGTPVAFIFACRPDTGLTLSINGVAATPSTADLFDITALTPAAAEDIGSLNAASVAHGYFKSLGVT